jgi:arsenite-transporting ATPase
MLRLPDVLRFFMENFFDAKRRAMRLVRPVAERVGAGWLVAPDSVFEAFERLYQDVEDVRQILLDGERTSARLVVNPARVVVDETRRSFAYLSLYGVATDAVLVNRVLPPDASRGWFARWAEREKAEREAIASSFPVPRFEAPLLPREPIGADALRALGLSLYGETDPARLLCRSRPIRIEQRGSRTLLEIDLPHASPSEVDVAIHGEDLLVRMRDAQRVVSLPASVVGRELEAVRLQAGVLEIAFAPAVRPAG